MALWTQRSAFAPARQQVRGIVFGMQRALPVQGGKRGAQRRRTQRPAPAGGQTESALALSRGREARPAGVEFRESLFDLGLLLLEMADLVLDLIQTQVEVGRGSVA